jgi:hypothetical protein
LKFKYEPGRWIELPKQVLPLIGVTKKAKVWINRLKIPLPGFSNSLKIIKLY